MFFLPQFDVGPLEKIGDLKTSGVVKRRHAKTLSWGEIDGQGPVYLRDTVYTKDKGAAITFNNKKTLEMDRETMVQFDNIDGDMIEITLFSGNVRGDVRTFRPSAFNFFGFLKSFPAMPDANQLEAEHAQYSQKVRDFLEPKALRKTVSIRQKFLPIDKLAYYEIRLLLPPEKYPELQSNRWFPILWSQIPIKTAVHKLEVSQEPGFQSYLLKKTDTNLLMIQFDESGRYYWRVRVENKRERPIVSETREFTLIGPKANPRTVPSSDSTSAPSK
jgi:hypothetical protein